MKENTREKMGKLAHSAAAVLKQVGHVVGNYINSASEKNYLQVQERQAIMRQQQMQQEQQQMQQQVQLIMQEVARELFEVFRNSSYYCLKPVTSSMALRCAGFRYQNGVLFYLFSIQKAHLMGFLVEDQRKIVTDMNEDIGRFYHDVLFQYGEKWMWNFMPFLAGGLEVCNIADEKDRVTIFVTSGYCPIQFPNR